MGLQLETWDEYWWGSTAAASAAEYQYRVVEWSDRIAIERRRDEDDSWREFEVEAPDKVLKIYTTTEGMWWWKREVKRTEVISSTVTFNTVEGAKEMIKKLTPKIHNDNA